jgi:hypothetical protein
MIGEAMGVAQHHDAVSGTEKQKVAFDYAQRLSRGIEAAEVRQHLFRQPLVNEFNDVIFITVRKLHVHINSIHILRELSIKLTANYCLEIVKFHSVLHNFSVN